MVYVHTPHGNDDYTGGATYMEEIAAKYAHYLRVSTTQQGIDGYGIGAQRAAVTRYKPSAVFIEVESGRKKDRPELLKALAYCKNEKAVLVVGKLDRLARNVAFVSALMESKVEFICADYPSVTPLTIHILSAVAEHEAHMISTRTRQGLKAAKDRGVVLGKTMDTGKQDKGRETQAQIADRNAEKVGTTLNGLVAAKLSLRQIAAELNRMDVKTPRGKMWTAQAVKNALGREARTRC